MTRPALRLVLVIRPHALRLGGCLARSRLRPGQEEEEETTVSTATNRKPTPAKQVRTLTQHIRRLVGNDELRVMQAAKTGKPALLGGAIGDADALIVSVFPYRDKVGPPDALALARTMVTNPEIALEVIYQAVDEIDEAAETPLKTDSDGAPHDYHFPTDLTHPFVTKIEGIERSLLLTFENAGVAGEPHTAFHVVLYTRDAR